MLLAINTNNTNTKFAIYQGDDERGAWRIATDSRRTADEYAVWITHLMARRTRDRRRLRDRHQLRRDRRGG